MAEFQRPSVIAWFRPSHQSPWSSAFFLDWLVQLLVGRQCTHLNCTHINWSPLSQSSCSHTKGNWAKFSKEADFFLVEHQLNYQREHWEICGTYASKLILPSDIVFFAFLTSSSFSLRILTLDLSAYEVIFEVTGGSSPPFITESKSGSDMIIAAWDLSVIWR